MSDRCDAVEVEKPAEIWARCRIGDYGFWVFDQAWDSKFVTSDPGDLESTKYVRADLHDAALAEIKRLTELLNVVEGASDGV